MRCLLLLPIQVSKALALPTPHRIDNAVSPRQHELYINNKVYRNAPRRRFGCHLPVVVFGICEILDTQRQTFENVFLIYKTARSPATGLTSDGAKVEINSETPKIFKRKCRKNASFRFLRPYHQTRQGTSTDSFGAFSQLSRAAQLSALGLFRPSNNRLPPVKRSFDGRRTII